MKNRFPSFVRFVAFALGVAAMYLVYWARIDEPNFKMLTQVTLALGGAAAMCINIAFWPTQEKSWRYKTLFVSVASFLAGVTWIGVMSEGSFISIPGVLMVCSIALGIAAVFAPKRSFEPSFG